MGLGNGNPKEGDKGSNFAYELKVLQGLEAIAVAIESGGGGLRVGGPLSFPEGLPTSTTGLVTGDLYTQTTTELGIVGGGAQKVICIV